MIQELISTSAPRCLNGNAGFGIVAQTVGMAPNVSQAVNALSGYTHVAPPGSPKNPVVYMHAIRRTGGMTRYIVSRVADCGNDYSGRSNRIAHHWIVESPDISSLPGGPPALIKQDIFRSDWNEKPAELPPKQLVAPDVSSNSCPTWERLTGDAGWGKVVAERASKGNPISIVFPPECSSDNLRDLLSEALALLPSAVRWKVTFSTYFMRSQEASGDKIQIKCFLADSEAAQFVQQSPATLVIDLRKQLGAAPVVKLLDASSSRYDRSTRKKVEQSPTDPEENWWELSSPSISTAPLSVPLKQPRIKEYWKEYLAVFIAVVLYLGLMGAFWTQQGTLWKTLDKARKKMDEHVAERIDGYVDERNSLNQTIEILNAENERLTKENIDLGASSGNLVIELNKKADALAQANSNILVNQRTIENLNEQNAKLIAAKREPIIWKGLASLSDNEDKPYTFDALRKELMSRGLDEERFDELRKSLARGEDKSITYVSFVNTEQSNSIKEEGRSFTIKEGERKDSNRVWQFFASSGGNEIRIAEIEFSDEGIHFKWVKIEGNENVPDWGQELQGDEWNKIRNRILLSKLRITVDGDAHPIYDIALWDPDIAVQQEFWAIFDRSSDYSLGNNLRINRLTEVPQIDSFLKKLRDDGNQPDHKAVNDLLQHFEFFYLIHPKNKDDKLLIRQKLRPT